MDRIAIKERSKQILKKNHWLCVGVAFLGTFLPGVLAGGGTSFNFNFNQTTTPTPPTTTIPFKDVEPGLIIAIILISLLAIAMSYVIRIFLLNQLMVGSCRFFLKFRKNNPTDIGELFHSYKDKTFLNVAKVTFLRDLFITLWTLLFVIPGIIKAFEYWAVDYILAVRPDMPYNKALDLSKKMMHGHKMDVFVMEISFFGWYLLSAFTLGILPICYVNPYVQIAMTELYSEIREDAIRRGIVSPYDVPDYMDYQPQSPYYPYYNVNPTQPANGAQAPNGYYYQPQAQQTAPNAPFNPVNTQYGAYPQSQPAPQPQPFAYGQVNYNQPAQPFAQTPGQVNAQPQQPIYNVPQPVADVQATVDSSLPVQEPVTPEAPVTADAIEAQVVAEAPDMPEDPDTF